MESLDMLWLGRGVWAGAGLPWAVQAWDAQLLLVLILCASILREQRSPRVVVQGHLGIGPLCLPRVVFSPGPGKTPARRRGMW